MGFHGRHELLGCLGQSDQMDPAGHVALGHPGRAEQLRAAQRRLSGRHHDAESVDVTAQTPREVLHVGGGLRQRRVLVQHERHRLRRGHCLIALRPRLDDDSIPLVGANATGVPAGSQREAHDTTPVRIQPS